VSERYDGNIMLQNEGPLAHIESSVTAVQPVVAPLQVHPPLLEVSAPRSVSVAKSRMPLPLASR
jgi:hypothetical protein